MLFYPFLSSKMLSMAAWYFKTNQEPSAFLMPITNSFQYEQKDHARFYSFQQILDIFHNFSVLLRNVFRWTENFVCGNKSVVTIARFHNVQQIPFSSPTKKKPYTQGIFWEPYMTYLGGNVVTFTWREIPAENLGCLNDVPYFPRNM